MFDMVRVAVKTIYSVLLTRSAFWAFRLIVNRAPYTKRSSSISWSILAVSRDWSIFVESGLKGCAYGEHQFLEFEWRNGPVLWSK